MGRLSHVTFTLTRMSHSVTADCSWDQQISQKNSIFSYLELLQPHQI